MIQTDLPTAGFGETLRGLRRKAGWTLERTARTAGIARVTLNRWETGVNQPRLLELEAVLNALVVPAPQRRALIARMDSPRAAAHIRREAVEIGERLDIGPMPSGGDLLQAMRLRRGLSLEAVAVRLGVTARTLRFWEKGEIWPASESLHRFGAVVNAQSEEIAALSGGRFLQNPGAAGIAPSVESLEAERKTLARQIHSGESELMGLRLLSLEMAAWKHAARTAQGRDLLSPIYLLHCRYRDFRGYGVQAGVYAERALALMPVKRTPEPFHVDAAVFVANAYALSGARHGPKRAVALLRQWRPLARRPSQEAWVLSAIANALAHDGAMEEAVAVGAEACAVVEREFLPRELARRKHDFASLLTHSGRPTDALPLLADLGADTIYFDAHVALTQVRPYLALGEMSVTHDYLQHALRSIEIIRSVALQETADALSLLF